MSKKLTNEEFIEKCKNIHKDRYDYSKAIYPGSRDSKDKIIVICREHGEFLITVYNHIVNRHGCIECIDSRKITQKKFIKKIIEISSKVSQVCDGAFLWQMHVAWIDLMRYTTKETAKDKESFMKICSEVYDLVDEMFWTD